MADIKTRDTSKGTVRRHIVVGANRILFSANMPIRLCRAGTYCKISAVSPHIVVALFERQAPAFETRP